MSYISSAQDCFFFFKREVDKVGLISMNIVRYSDGSRILEGGFRLRSITVIARVVMMEAF